MDIDSCFRNGESGAEDGRSGKGGRGKRIYTTFPISKATINVHYLIN